ncbi:MAG: DUF1844 domain-containing protein [Candidatus Eisenbacteria bacterium]|nr:DUF1844 domain-containing protein [Candidatus Eisenbacteria bacterium]
MADEKSPDIHTFRFLALIDSLRHAATLFMGEAEAPEGEGGSAPEPEKTRESLEKARHYIDFLATLEVKTRGNLSDPEKRYLDDLLAALRLKFVDAAEKAGEGAGRTSGADSDPAREPEESGEEPGEGER